MDTLLERLSSGQIVAVVSILVGGLVALATIFAISKYQFQSLDEESQLRREKQQGELAMRERVLESAAKNGASIEALLDLGVSSPEPQEADRARHHGCRRG